MNDVVCSVLLVRLVGSHINMVGLVGYRLLITSLKGHWSEGWQVLTLTWWLTLGKRREQYRSHVHAVSQFRNLD